MMGASAGLPHDDAEAALLAMDAQGGQDVLLGGDQLDIRGVEAEQLRLRHQH